MLNHLLIAAAILAGYCLLALAVPLHRCVRCVRCRGRSVVPRGPRHRVPCRWCRGRGLQPWPGGRLIHRTFWLILGHHLMQHRRERKDT
jgi:hypothetical protein